MRNRVVPALGAVLGLAMAAACGTPAATEGADGQDIVVAIIPPASGALAQYGSDAAQAWQYAVDEANAAGGVDGHRVELVKLDTDGTPANTLRAAREAVTKRGATFIGGVMTSTEHGALNAQLEGLGALSFNSLGKDDALTGKDCKANAFRVVQNNAMDVTAVAKTLAELPGEKWAIQAVDYSTGHTAAKIFTEAAAAAGKQVVLEQYSPLNTTDFGSAITELQNSDADALFAVEYGADGVAFVNQAAQFELTKKFRTVLGFNMVSEPLFDALGDKVAGFYNNVGYDVNADNAKNRAFVAGFEKKYGSKPYYVQADSYLAAQTLFEGIRKAGSTDVGQVRDALADLSFDSIAGEVTMRGADHQLLRPSYLGKVVEKAGKLSFEVVATADAKETSPAPDPACRM